MKITPIQIIQTWNVLDNLSQVYEGKNEFSTFIKRFFAYAQSEVKIWNDLSEKEREAIKDKEINLPVEKVELPNDLPNYAYDLLKPIAKGKIEKPKSEIEKLLTSDKDTTKPKKQ